MGGNLMKTALDVLQEMIDSGKYREINGPNRSPAIDALCKEFGYDLGSSWCALFVSKGFKEVSIPQTGKVFHYTAGSQDLLRFFQLNNWVSSNPQSLIGWKGALAIRTNPDGQHGHVVAIANRLTDKNGTVVAIRTAEGNTNSQGSSNGEGAYNLKRIIPLTPYRWTFCNTSYITGGSWWK